MPPPPGWIKITGSTYKLRHELPKLHCEFDPVSGNWFCRPTAAEQVQHMVDLGGRELADLSPQQRKKIEKLWADRAAQPQRDDPSEG